MSVEENNQDLEVLKEEALDLGIKFSDNIGYGTLAKRIEEKKESIAKKQEEKKEAKKAKAEIKKVKVIIEPRDGDDKITEQFIGFNGYTCLVKFGEEVELPENVVKFIKSKGTHVQVKKTVLDADGIPQNKFTKKWRSRFIVEKVD